MAGRRLTHNNHYTRVTIPGPRVLVCSTFFSNKLLLLPRFPVCKRTYSSTIYILTRRLCLGACINNSGAGIYHPKKPATLGKNRCTAPRRSQPSRKVEPAASSPWNSACATIQEVYRNWVRATGPIFIARMPSSHAHCPSSRRACDRRWWQSSTITRCRTGLGLVLPTNQTKRLCSIFVRHLPPKRRVATASGRSRSGLLACASMASGAMATRLSVPFCSSMCACLGAASAAPGTSLSSSSSSSSSSNSSNSSSSSRRAMPPMLPRPRCRPRCRLASDAAPDPASPLMPPRPQCRPRCPRLAPNRRSPRCRLTPDAAPDAAPVAARP